MIHEMNHKWWHDKEGKRLQRNKGELLCLIHSEISEWFDGEIEDLMDDKLLHRKMGEVEAADAFIRTLDYAKGFNHDIYKAGLRYGVSDFIDLNHFFKCALFTDAMIAELKIHGVSLIHRQISRVMENERKNQPEVAENLFLLLLQIAALCRLRDYDLNEAFIEKCQFNQTRHDHTHEAREQANGKKW